MTDTGEHVDGSPVLAGEVTIYQKPAYTVVKLVFQNPADRPIEVHYEQSFPEPLPDSHVTFASQYHGDSWSHEGETLYFSIRIEPSTTVRTAYGTKGIELEPLRNSIHDGTVTIFDDDAQQRGKLTGLDPAVARRREDNDDAGTESAGVGGDLIGEDEPQTNRAGEDEPQIDQGDKNESPSSETDNGESNATDVDVAKTLTADPEEDASGKATGSSSTAGMESENGDTEGTGMTSSTGTPTEADISDAMQSEHSQSVTTEGSDDSSESTDSTVQERVDSNRGSNTQGDGPSDDVDEHDDSANEPEDDADKSGKLDRSSTSEDSAPLYEELDDIDSEGYEWTATEAAESSTTEATTNNDDRVTADLPANRSDFVLSDLPDDINSPEEFKWVDLNGSPSAGKRLIGWVKSLFG